MVNETTTTRLTKANGPSVQGDLAVTIGTFTARTAATGDNVTAFIDTGLRECLHFRHETTLAASATTALSVGSTFPVAGGVVDVTVLANSTGHWIAWGK